MKKSVLLFFITCCLVNNAIAATRFVTPSGAGLMNGTNWANAFPGTSLQFAINSSLPGDEVWVMSGVYFTTATADRNIFFSMRNGVAVYGSFNGTETSLAQRNFSCGFSSALSGEIGAPGNADNSYHVISNSSLNTTAVIDGFTIRDGHANFDLVGNDNRSLGGGMINVGSNGGICTPTIRNCLFTDNTALFGGGIFDHGQNGGNASPVITNCIFAFNTATGGGGGIDNFGYNGNASPVITNSLFYMNTATDRAGAMYCWGGGNGNASPVILNSTFINNSSFDGGGIVADRSNFVSGNSGTATPTIRNCIFWGNTAGGTGPQFFLIGGAGFSATYSVIDLSNQTPPHTITGPGTGNITIAPAFLNSANAIGPDNCWLTSDDGLQLQGISSGIDAGDNIGVPVTDIRGYNRISNSIVDMGAYEFNSTALPVTLLSFTGETNRFGNQLFWVTGFELNSDRFEIERSENGTDFIKIGELPTTSTGISNTKYQFSDNRITNEKYYYRLKIIDRDDHYDFSKVIIINNRNYSQVLVFPNPVSSIATIYSTDEYFIGEEFILININGQILRKWKINVNKLEIDLTAQPAGTYYITCPTRNVSVKIQKIL